MITVLYLKKIAKRQGGELLSKKYKSVSGKLRWKCKLGHIWSATYDSIRKGSWCRICSKRPVLTLLDMQNVARSRGGKCLSKDYIDQLTPLVWQCHEGHVWTARPNNVRNNNSWCPKCKIFRGEEVVRIYFESIFGKPFPKVKPDWLRSDDTNRKLELDGYCEELKLAFEHQGIQHLSKSKHFFRRPKDIKNTIASRDLTKKRKCKKKGIILFEIPEVPTITQLDELPLLVKQLCRKNKINFPKKGTSFNNSVFSSIELYTKNKLNFFKELAKVRGGKCLSLIYISSSQKLEWKCKNGHRWSSVASSVKSGRWCKVCVGLSRGTIDEMHKLAKIKGGKCLSKKYINSSSKLLWQCKNHHQWNATPSGVKNQGTWCPVCARTAKHTIKDFKVLAAKRGGKCLTKEYINNKQLMKWKCKKGHEWLAKVADVLNKNSWCGVCAGTARGTIEEMTKLAAMHHGKCLSKRYINSSSKLKWECKHKHRWEATPYSIKIRRSWCPECSGTKKHTLKAMKILAKKKGGLCLSREYLNNKSLMKWKCKEGHTWEARAHDIISKGSWCKICSTRKSRKSILR